MTLGVSISFQGKEALALPFSYERAAGLEPSFGEVHLRRQDLADFTVKESTPGVDAPVDDTKTRERGRALLSVGRLVFSETAPGPNGGEEKHEVVFDQVLVTERAIETPVAFDAGEQVVRVELTDARYLWGTRGVPVFGWVNVPRRKEDKPAKGSQAKRETIEAEDLVPGSLRGEKPWTVREVLEVLILPKLPFAPKLKRFPPAYENSQPRALVWDNGESPKEALRQVLAQFDLMPALELDGSVSIWERGEGDLELVGGQKLEHDPSSPNADPRVADSRELVTYHHKPAVCVVLGGPIVRTERVELEPVGEVHGKIVPIAEALAAIGLPVEHGLRCVFLTHEKRLELLTEAGVREFERWAWKWFRIPGGQEALSAKLPLLPGRGVVDAIGQYLPPRVFSETFTVIGSTELLDKIMKDALDASTEIADKEERDRLRVDLAKASLELFADLGGVAGSALDKVTGGIFEPLSRIRKDVEETEARERRERAEASEARERRQAALDLARGKRREAAELRRQIESLRRVSPRSELLREVEDEASKLEHEAREHEVEARTEKERARDRLLNSRKVLGRPEVESALKAADAYRIVRNLDFAEQTSGWQLDANRGIVEFTAPQGRARTDGVSPELAALALNVRSSDRGRGRGASFGPRVELEYGYVVKPSWNGSPRLEDRYHAVFVRDARGRVKQVEAIPEGSAPIVVREPGLELVFDVDGKSNEHLLKIVAGQAARSAFAGLQAEPGAVVTFCRPVAVRTNGHVLSVVWSTEGERPRVVARLASWPPLSPSPPPGAGTRAFGPQGRAGGAVFTPGGLP